MRSVLGHRHHPPRIRDVGRSTRNSRGAAQQLPWNAVRVRAEDTAVSVSARASRCKLRTGRAPNPVSVSHRLLQWVKTSQETNADTDQKFPQSYSTAKFPAKLLQNCRGL